MIKPLLIITALIILTGCFSMKVDREVTALDSVELSQSFFVLGLLGDKEVDLTETCPRGVASVTERFTFTDMLASLLTLGIYTPKTVLVYCQS